MLRALASAAVVATAGLLAQGCACDCEPRPRRPAATATRDPARDPVGTTFTFDDRLEVTWLAADRVRWTERPAATDGPAPAARSGEDFVAADDLRRGVRFVRWRGQVDGATRLQVVDLGAGLAATTTVSRDGLLDHGRAVVRPTAGPAPTPGSPTNLTGRSFVLDFGPGAATRAMFADRGRLAWEELRGATKGASGEAALESTEVRPGLLFVRWRDGDRLVAAVLDLDLRRVVRTVVPAAGPLEHAEGALLDADS